MRHPPPLPLLLFPVLASCTRGARPAPGTGETSTSLANDVAEPSQTTADFSAPIAAARTHGVDIVAGLVAKDGVVRAVGLIEGRPAWKTDVLYGVAWAPDAELRLQPAGSGIAVAWRGPRSGKSGRAVVVVGANGAISGDPFDVGAMVCTTAEGIAWTTPHASGSTRIRSRRWPQVDAGETMVVSAERDTALVCGDHEVFVLGDGDDDITAATFVPGDAAPSRSLIILRDGDFVDEERDHEAYSAGDDLGLVRVGVSGAIAARDLPAGGVAGPWHKWKHVLSGDDEVVAIDGDKTATLIVVTRETDRVCSGGSATAESVRALRVDRSTGVESVVDLASADCDVSRGPFWIGQVHDGPMVGWVERRTKAQAKDAPISAIAYRIVGVDGVRVGRIDQQADAVANGGCDERGCSVAALVRVGDGDGLRPAPIRVLAYP